MMTSHDRNRCGCKDALHKKVGFDGYLFIPFFVIFPCLFNSAVHSSELSKSNIF